MSDDPLPREPLGRVLVALLALPSFIVALCCLIGIPIAAGRPRTPAEWVLAILLGELFGVATVFLLFVLLWCAATPRWVGLVLRTPARRLTIVTGVFLIVGGAIMLYGTWNAKTPVPAIVTGVGIVMGAVMLWRGVRGGE